MCFVDKRPRRPVENVNAPRQKSRRVGRAGLGQVVQHHRPCAKLMSPARRKTERAPPTDTGGAREIVRSAGSITLADTLAAPTPWPWSRSTHPTMLPPAGIAISEISKRVDQKSRRVGRAGLGQVVQHHRPCAKLMSPARRKTERAPPTDTGGAREIVRSAGSITLADTLAAPTPWPWSRSTHPTMLRCSPRPSPGRKGRVRARARTRRGR